MIELIITSVAAFASTNIDDIFILMLFFSNKEYNSRQVVVGQYLGIIILIAISVIGSLIGLFIEHKYIGLLGFMPIYLGIIGLIRYVKSKQENEVKQVNLTPQKENKVFSVATVTFANGGDNIGIYIPLFATISTPQKLVMITIFLVMVAVWCVVAKYLSKHKLIAQTIDRYGHIITPIVLILLGFYILFESGTFSLLHGV